MSWGQLDLLFDACMLVVAGICMWLIFRTKKVRPIEMKIPKMQLVPPEEVNSCIACSLMRDSMDMLHMVLNEDNSPAGFNQCKGTLMNDDGVEIKTLTLIAVSSAEHAEKLKDALERIVKEGP